MNEEELKKAVAEKAKTVRDNSGRSAMAALITDIVQPNHLSFDIFSAFMRTTTFKAGDAKVHRVRRGRYPVRTMVPGSKHLHDVTSYAEKQTFVFDRLITGTSANLWEIESGEVGTVQMMRDELRADLFDALVSKVFTLLSTVWTTVNAGAHFVDASGTGVTQTVLDTMIETVLDTAPNVKAIVGSRKALLPIYKFAQYREFVLSGTGNNPDRAMFPTALFDEFTRTGKVSTYLGIPLIELPQVYSMRLPNYSNDGATLRDKLIPTDKILVIGEDVGEIGLEGGMVYQDYTDLTTQPANYVVHGWQGYGMIIDNVEGIGVIKSNT